MERVDKDMQAEDTIDTTDDNTEGEATMKPNDGESQDDFMKRCIPAVIDDGSATGNAQAVAMCTTMFDKTKAMCETCNGNGYTEENKSYGGQRQYVKHTCHNCNGFGTVKNV